MTPLLQVRRLAKAWPRPGGARRAVDDVSFDLHAGEILGLVGESGSGKTTLARCLARLDAPDAGEVLLDGRDLAALEGGALRAARRDLQIVFQDPGTALDPRLTAGDTVAEGLAVHGLARGEERAARVGTLLARVGLPADAAGKKPHAFSGGQRQRIALARALAVEPKLLVLDEALSALDVSVQAQVANLLEEIRRERNVGMLFVAHDLRMTRHLCDRVAVMYEGRIVELAPTGELFAKPRHPYSELLVSGRVEGPRAPAAPPVGCAFAARCPEAPRFKDRCARVRPPLYLLGPKGERACACFLVESEAVTTPTPDALPPGYDPRTTPPPVGWDRMTK